MKTKAVKRSAGRTTKENSCHNGTDFCGVRFDERIAENSSDSAKTIQRYIRLTELEPELMQMVDEGEIGMTLAVVISYLKPEEQSCSLSPSTANRLPSRSPKRRE